MMHHAAAVINDRSHDAMHPPFFKKINTAPSPLKKEECERNQQDES